MKKDCRNDCLESLRFPVAPENRPGLSHIHYRTGTYAEIREALLRNLDKTPGLAQWTHRGADDPGIALLEGAAILGDILTFYQELYANEAYLRTAQWRESIADLVRLCGYRLSPGLGGNATFAFEVKGDHPVTVPAGFPVKAEVEGLDKTADFETAEPAIAYPWLSKFSLYRRLFTPNIDHDTTEFYIYAPDQFLTPTDLKAKDRLLIGEADNPANPTRLSNAEIVIIDSVRELHGRKLYKIKGALKRTSSTFSLTAYKIGRSFHHFGNNGPRTFTKAPANVTSTATATTAGGKTTTTVTSPTIPEKNIAFSRWLDSNTQSFDPAVSYPNNTATTRIVIPSLGLKEFPLDSEVQDLAAGVNLIIQATCFNYADTSQSKEFTFVRSVQSLKQTSLTWGVVTGTTSLVTLNQPISVNEGSVFYRFTDIREFLLHEVLSPALELRGGHEETTDVTGAVLYFYGTDSEAQALNDRRLLLIKSGVDPIPAQVVDVETLAAQFALRPLLRRITLDRTVTLADFPNEKPAVTVYGNLVDATQGKSEAAAPLGNGDNRLVFQNFKLPKTPLTYLISPNDTPAEVPQLQIYVNNRLWERVPSFFGRRPDEEIYIVREDAENNSWVQFGDGETGARLPSGVKNVVAKYRTGTGAFGALKFNTKAQAGGKLDGLDKIQMPEVAAGGSQPEDGENARNAAPGKIQSLDRLVSLEDFESETLAISGVTKVAAAWQLVDNIPGVVLTVLMETGRSKEIDAVRETLTAYDKGRGANRFPISVPEGSRRKYVVIKATFGYDSTYLEEEIKTAIRKALGVNSGKPNAADDQSGLFSLQQRRFGQKEYATSIAGRIQQVEGVVWAQVIRFHSLGVLDDPTTIVPPDTPGVVKHAVSCQSQNVLSLYSGHLQLTGVAEILPEVK